MSYNNMTDAVFRCNKKDVWELERSARTYYWADSYCPTKFSWMAVLGLALFVMGFAPGELSKSSITCVGLWRLVICLFRYISLCCIVWHWHLYLWVYLLVCQGYVLFVPGLTLTFICVGVSTSMSRLCTVCARCDIDVYLCWCNY